MQGRNKMDIIERLHKARYGNDVDILHLIADKPNTKGKRIHYITAFNRLACGMNPKFVDNCTSHPDKVTCHHCIRHMELMD